ncbi:helix-turn-helix domain-containing protein [Snodgrassella alvi]|uniref:helix-turn-helix domain-containing protein n=1 Tax=Snodgrassella alvi TaxID=1196083 RepID=UPI00351C21C6
MAITEFGKAIRKARIDINATMVSMADDLGVSVAFLSSLENGRKKISDDWVKKIDNFFLKNNKEIKNLKALAEISNKVVPIDNLSFEQQMLISHFAKTRLTSKDLKKFADIINSLNKEND